MRRILSNFLIGLSLTSLISCNRHTFFYYPTRILYVEPEKAGLTYELLHYPSLNGKNLYALLFRTQQKPIGMVVHFHGNYGNVSNHFMESQFLTKYGFDVLIFDYQGYGGSEGKPTPKRTMEDGIATVRLAQSKNRSESDGVVVFGQSLGAAVATVVSAQEPLVKAVVLESGFSSYRSIARDVLARSFLTWPLYPFYPLFLTWSYDPVQFISKISPRPVFILHGTKDNVIPVKMASVLYKAAKEPKKIWIIENAGHLQLRAKEGIKYEQAIANFFKDALGVKNTTDNATTPLDNNSAAPK